MMKKATFVPLFLACFAMTPTVAQAGPPASVTPKDPPASVAKRVELLGLDLCIGGDEPPGREAEKEECDLSLSSTPSSVPAWNVATRLVFAVLPDVLDGGFVPAEHQAKGASDASRG